MVKCLIRKLIRFLIKLIHDAELSHHRFNFYIHNPVSKEKQMIELTCTNEEKILVTVNPTTSTGKPTKLDGAVSVTVESGSGSAVVQEDGLSFYLISGDDAGDTTFVVTADADLGEGVVSISDAIILHVAGALAKNLGLVAGSPEPK